jgi:hypothetical protein
MTPETFRQMLAALLQAAAESGLDIFLLHAELTQAGEQLLGDCRCDLVEIDG